MDFHINFIIFIYLQTNKEVNQQAVKSSSQSTSHQVCIQLNFSNLLSILPRRGNILQQLLSNLSAKSIASHFLFISQALSKFTSNDVYSIQKSSKDVATRFPRNITSTSKMKLSIQKR